MLPTEMDKKMDLDNLTIARYSRQMILPEVGRNGQVNLKNGKVLIVGAGGLGCPAAQYLCAAGVGTIGVVDYDTVEISNLHRQILHTESRTNKDYSKAQSIAEALKELNSETTVITHTVLFSRDNAVKIVKNYDVVLDATDNVTTRYLVNDACVINNKPLISGSALRWEGQLTIYHFTTTENEIGPCYRCLYPKPPPPETVTNCSDGGVMGVIPGIIGSMQALEAIKILINTSPSYHQKLYLFDGLAGSHRIVKLRPRKTDCVVCGKDPVIVENEMPNYEEFCGASANDKCIKVNLLPDKDRVTANEYQNIVKQNTDHILIDVRPKIELTICQLPNCINVPLNAMNQYLNGNSKELDAIRNLIEEKNTAENQLSIYVVCRLGNDSQKAVVKMREIFSNKNVHFKDIKGGLMAWAKQIDSTFPTY